MKRLEGKVALVTGAGSGMGRSIAERFAAEGASVVIADLNAERASQVVEEIVAAGGSAVEVDGNVMSQTDVDAMVDAAVERFGTLDILVNNAGIMDSFHTAESVSDDTWDLVMGVNTTGPLRLMRRTLPIFVEKGSGVIINICSIGGLFGSRAGIAYTASKHALVGMTKNVGFQYASQGIRCNGIAPGAVETNIGESMHEPDPFGAERAMIGMGINPGTGQPEEIANLALFLASDESSMINGAIIVADKGWTAY